MESASRVEVTRLLHKWSSGDRSALDQLIPVVYQELRRLAAGYMRREREGHTLQPTALVHEAFLRLVGEDQVEWTDRAHFFAVAARLMRRILVDHARRRRRHKRGGGHHAVTLDEGLLPAGRPGDLVVLDDALDALASYDERKARALELHHFGGLTHEEVGAVLGIHANTVAHELRAGRAWLQKQLKGAR